MSQIATITSKMQLTLPAKVVNKLKLKVGQKVFVDVKDDSAEIRPVENLVEELAGSLQPPKVWQGKSIDQIVKDSKKEYFARTHK